MMTPARKMAMYRDMLPTMYRTAGSDGLNVGCIEEGMAIMGGTD
jgi:hypothetical protein